MNIQKLYNPLIALLLRSPLHGLLSSSTALLTIEGRRSGRSYTFPVNYVRDGDNLLILSKAGRLWWRNLQKSTDLLITVAGRQYQAHGEVFSEPMMVMQKLSAMLKLNETLRRFFKVTLQDNGSITSSPTLDEALPSMIIVQIKLVRL